MKIFLDANVIVAVINKEFPLFNQAARILSLSQHSDYQIFTSPLCLAIAFYFASKKSGEDLAKKKIKKLTENIQITSINQQICHLAGQNPQIHDFEDGMEYYSALEAACDLIITENKEDFYFSQIALCNCEEFISQYF
ncbi:MAG: type II toxin-antitoxin system VapC family toxin [Candidatus Cyclobacteriaceae bacterium M3_2C_046]